MRPSTLTLLPSIFALICALVTAAPATKEKRYSVMLTLIVVVDLTLDIEVPDDGTTFAMRMSRGFL